MEIACLMSRRIVLNFPFSSGLMQAEIGNDLDDHSGLYWEGHGLPGIWGAAMELIVQVQNGAAATAALEAGAAGGAVRLPREPAPAWWSEAGAWQAAVRQRHRKFYLVWDRLGQGAGVSSAPQKAG